MRPTRCVRRHDHSLLTEKVAIHLIELPRVDHAPPDEPPALVRWARFLRATRRAELDCLAAEDPIMARAKDALERLSEDDEAHWLAEARIKADMNIALQRAAAMREGRAEGRAEGATEVLRRGIEKLASSDGLVLTDAQRSDLESASGSRLQQIFDALCEQRGWPS